MQHACQLSPILVKCYNFSIFQCLREMSIVTADHGFTGPPDKLSGAILSDPHNPLLTKLNRSTAKKSGRLTPVRHVVYSQFHRARWTSSRHHLVKPAQRASYSRTTLNVSGSANPIQDPGRDMCGYLPVGWPAAPLPAVPSSITSRAPSDPTRYVPVRPGLIANDLASARPADPFPNDSPGSSSRSAAG